MPSGSRIVLRTAAEADIPTPDTDQVALFADSDDAGAPAWKDDGGTVHSLTGPTGADAPPLSYLDHGNTGSTETVDASAADVHRLVANAATVTLTLTGAPASGTPAIIQLWLEQDGTGGRDWAFPGSVVWGPGGEPTWTDRGAGDIDLVSLETVDGGTVWVANLAGQPGPPGADGADGADGTSGAFTQSYVGYNTVGGSFFNMGGQYAKKITLGSAGLIASIDVYVKGNGSNVMTLGCAILDDNAGAPGHVIAMTPAPVDRGSFPGLTYTAYIDTTGRWLSMAIGKWLAAGDYWLLVHGGNSDGGTQLAYDGSGSDYSETAQLYLTENGTGLTNSGNKYSIRASLIQ